MIEYVVQLDYKLFYAINHSLSNPFFDWLMPLLRNRYFWSPLYLFLIIFLIRNYGKTGIIMVAFLLLTFGLADTFSSAIIKPQVERLRPCNDLSVKAGINSLVSCGTGFSFPSSHATNHFAIAVFLIALFYRKWKKIMPLGILWAFIISFAQVYVGVHFPFDVTAGAIFGSLIGYMTANIFLAIKPENTWNTGN